jgi:hypothetical protein
MTRRPQHIGGEKPKRETWILVPSSRETIEVVAVKSTDSGARMPGSKSWLCHFWL